MADYKFSGNGVVRLSDGAFIPNDEGNRHWAEYQEYVAGGGITDPEFTQTEIDDRTAAEARRLERMQERLADRLDTMSVQEINDWVDDKFAQATNTAQTVQVIKQILKKLIILSS